MSPRLVGSQEAAKPRKRHKPILQAVHSEPANRGPSSKQCLYFPVFITHLYSCPKSPELYPWRGLRAYRQHQTNMSGCTRHQPFRPPQEPHSHTKPIDMSNLHGFVVSKPPWAPRPSPARLSVSRRSRKRPHHRGRTKARWAAIGIAPSLRYGRCDRNGVLEGGLPERQGRSMDGNGIM